jgi:hypothetical protein
MLHIVQLLDCVQVQEKGKLKFFRLKDLNFNQSKEVKAITREKENNISFNAFYLSLD